MLSYAGQPFSPLVEPLRLQIERWWVEHAPDLWAWPGYSLEGIHHLPIPDRPKHEPARLGTLIWPTGASRWPVFHGLAGAAAADAMTAAADAGPQTLLMSDEVSGKKISPSMYLLSVRPVFVQGAADARLRWVTLVGAPFYWWTRQPSYTFADGDSWSTLLTNLVTAASGLTPFVPSVPAEYDKPSFGRWGGLTQPLPLLIDAAAASVGLRFVFNLDGTCGFQTTALAKSADETRWQAYSGEVGLGGRMSVSDVIGAVPARVSVGFGDPPVVKTKTLASLAVADYGSAIGVADTDAWVYGDLPRSTGSSTLQAYADRAALDYYLWALSLTDATFRNVLPLTGPTGLEDRIEWEYQPGRRDFASDTPRHPDDKRMPWERLVTRVVPRDWADRNQYGSTPGTCSGWVADEASLDTPPPVPAVGTDVGPAYLFDFPADNVSGARGFWNREVFGIVIEIPAPVNDDDYYELDGQVTVAVTVTSRLTAGAAGYLNLSAVPVVAGALPVGAATPPYGSPVPFAWWQYQNSSPFYQAIDFGNFPSAYYYGGGAVGQTVWAAVKLPRALFGPNRVGKLYVAVRLILECTVTGGQVYGSVMVKEYGTATYLRANRKCRLIRPAPPPALVAPKPWDCANGPQFIVGPPSYTVVYVAGVTVPDGPYAGTYTAVGAAGPGYGGTPVGYVVYPLPPAAPNYLSVSFSWDGREWYARAQNDLSGAVTPAFRAEVTHSVGPPGTASFPGSLLGGTADITLTIACAGSAPGPGPSRAPVINGGTIGSTAMG